jgi:site-specific recombinase XerD
VIDYAEQNLPLQDDHSQNSLIEWRDRAFILTLADTGLRVHEACNLTRGDINFDDGTAVIIGKGNKQAVVRFSTRSLNAIKDYLKQRSKLDSTSLRPNNSLPVFARHNICSRRKVATITTSTGESIVDLMKGKALGDEATLYTITPHSFRHRFVTEIVRKTGNLKLAQELARHSSITITERYTHICDDDLNKGFNGVFNSNITNNTE